MKEGRLFLSRGTAKLPIRKTGENQFSVTSPGASQGQKFTLVPGKDGKIAYLCFDERASRKI